MDLFSFFDDARAAVSLLDALRTVMENVKDEPDANLRSTLSKLRDQAATIAEVAASKIDYVTRGMLEIGIDLDRSLIDAEKQLNGLGWIGRIRFRYHARLLWSLKDDIQRFVSDVQALYYCAGRSNGLASVVSRAYKTRQELDRLFRDERPIRAILETMSRTVNEISAVLSR
jgi:hypothetical protein